MNTRSFGLTVCLIICLSLAVSGKFPEDPKPCKYEDAECLTRLIEYFLSEKREGDSSINLAKIDPLPVKKATLQRGAENAVSIDLTFRNCNLYGLSKAKVIKVKGFGKDMTQTHEVVLRADRIDLAGEYGVKGKVLVLPITGTGQSNISLVNVDFLMKFIGAPVQKDGATYMKVEKFQLQPDPKRMIYKFENLFNGDKELSDNMNLFLNENWADIFKETKEGISLAFGKLFKGIIGRVFTKYPYEKFFDE